MLERRGRRWACGCRFGTVVVTEQVLAYQRRRLADHEAIDLIGARPAAARSFATQALWYELPTSAGPAVRVLGTLHAAEHSQIAVLPLLAMCDRWDIGGLSTNYHPQTGGPTIFIYDGHPGGIGITRRGYEAFERLVADAYRLVSECPCESGCPSCVQSPKCGNLNEPLSKAGCARAAWRDSLLAAAQACSSGSGSIGADALVAHQPLTQISKCRCGPSASPVLPTRPSRCPAAIGRRPWPPRSSPPAGA